MCLDGGLGGGGGITAVHPQQTQHPRPGRPKLLRIPTSPTTLWGLRVRQDGERGQGGMTLGRSAGGRVVGAMERVLHGPPPLLMPLDHVCPLPKVCSRGLS